MGEVEFRTLASPAPTNCWPQASTVHAPMLLKKACKSSIRHVLPSRGNVSFCNIITTRRKAAALETRMAIRVIGGISVTAISMKR